MIPETGLHATELAKRVEAFIDNEIAPVEAELHAADPESSPEERWKLRPQIEALRRRAKDAGLWNLFLPVAHSADYPLRFGTTGGRALSNIEYAPIAELTGRSAWAAYVFNCAAPDSGNMEVLLKYGDPEQRARWLEPLLDGNIRSGFAMTEPDVASSDATNMAATVEIGAEGITLNGTKWWTTGVGHPDCKVLLFMGVSDPDASRRTRHSIVIVPMDTPGVRVERLLPVMGRFDEPFGHGEVSFTDVRVPHTNLILGPGRAFEIARGRLGPGRIHHCMRLLGLAERALELACRRATSRTAFGRPLSDLGSNRERIARSRIAIDSARLLVLRAAAQLDQFGVDGAVGELSQMKAAVPGMVAKVVDFAMQIHGAAGLSDDFPLAGDWTSARALRLADGPDEVHLDVVATQELKKHSHA